MFEAVVWVYIFCGFLVSSSVALEACPDGKIILNVTSLEECNNKCIRYKKIFNEMTFTCTQASISPVVNETDTYTCTLTIESDWKMWIKNTERPYEGWRPYTHTRYTQGFVLGNGDFFGGTGIMAALTSLCSQCSIRFRMWDFQGHYGWVEYSPFSVSDTTQKTLSLGGVVAGVVGDAMSVHDGLPFSTQDQDYDTHATYNYANLNGPWWYGYSISASYLLNGDNGGLQWNAWRWGATRQKLQRVEVHVKCKGAE